MIPKNKKLSNIKPFNDFFFRSCYYHQLIAGYAHYGVDSLALIRNAAYIYRWDEEKKLMKPGFLDFLSDEELEGYTGVHLIKKTRSEDIAEEVSFSVARGYPTLFAVDCFYLPHREDTFEKAHVSHYLMAYGYTEGKEFIINEHMYSNSMFYLERTIPFETAARAYAGVAEDYARQAKPAVVKMKRVGPDRTGSIDWPTVCRRREAEIAASREALNRYMTYVAQLLESGEATPEDALHIVDAMNEIQWGMSSSRYKLRYQNSPPELAERMDRVIEDYRFLVGSMYRFNMTGAIKPQTAMKAAERCREAIRLGEEIHAGMGRGLV